MATVSQSPVSSDHDRDEWKQLPAAEWQRRLSIVHQAALRHVAAVGLDLDDDQHDISSAIVFGDEDQNVGVLLRPALRAQLQRVDAIANMARSRYPELRELDEKLCSLLITVSEAGFLFGVVAGCHMPWDVVAAMPAPYAPPAPRIRKRGAR